MCASYPTQGQASVAEMATWHWTCAGIGPSISALLSQAHGFSVSMSPPPADATRLHDELFQAPPS